LEKNKRKILKSLAIKTLNLLKQQIGNRIHH